MGVAHNSIRPLFVLGWPEWWHHHGKKIVLDNRERLPGHAEDIILCSQATNLSITHCEGRRIRWILRWTIVFSCESHLEAQQFIDTRTLEEMFGIRECIYANSRWLIKKYGGSSARECVFLRYKDWLNIPGPGTGNDGDPNLSVYVTEEIRDAIRVTIEKYKRK